MIKLDHFLISPKLLQALSKIDTFNGHWQALDTHTTALNLVGDVAAHGTELKKIIEPLKAHPLNTKILKALHASLSSDSVRGQFRAGDLALPFEQNGAEIGTLETANANQISDYTAKLLSWLNDALSQGTHHPLIIIGIFTSLFLQIAPFADSNVKLARLLITLLMIKSNYPYAGFMILDPIINDNGHQILNTLQGNQRSLENGAPKWDDWLLTFTGILISQIEQLQTRLNETASSDSLNTMPTLSLQLMECIKANKRTTMKDLITFTKGRRATIKLRLQELLKADLIKRHGAGRGVWYGMV